MKLFERGPSEPYRFLFPWGVASGFMGLILWFGFQAGLISFYPRQGHANIMYFGFLWSFIAGFLMTAVPKMTGTPLANRLEILLAMGFVGIQIVVNYLNQVPASILLFLIQTTFLLVFIGRRFLQKRRLPFEGFLFIPFAFFQAILAVILFLTYSSFSMNTFYLLAGEAFVLNLVVGVGTRLIPVLSRLPNSFTPDQKSNSNDFLSMIILAIFLNIGFIVQAFYNDQAGVAIRFFVVMYIAFKYFKITSTVSTKSFVGFGLRAGVLFIISSYGIQLFQPVQMLAVQHLIYIGGFVLITFMVGTRVMLAHGGQNLEYETQSSRIGGVALLFALASILRLLAGADAYGTVMKLGILLFIAASFLWFHKFIKILKGPA